MRSLRWIQKNKVAGFRGPSREELRFLKAQGIGAIMRMAEPHEARVSHEEVEAIGIKDIHEPVVNSTAPTPQQLDRMVKFIHECVAEDRPVAVTCLAGFGRTGTVLACYLVSIGHRAGYAMRKIVSIEEESQRQVVRDFENFRPEGHASSRPILRAEGRYSHLHRVISDSA